MLDWPLSMTSKERVLAALAHRQPDRVPVDFGSSAVTGIHVTCVAALREYYGLEKRLVKVREPYQMLGLIDEDLEQVLGLDVDGVYARNTMFGFPAEDEWKTWRLWNGLEVLVPEAFRTTTDAKGDTLIYPEGDLEAPPSGRMPKNGYFFDAIIRQEPLDEEKLDPADNLEEFGPMAEADLAHLVNKAKEVQANGRAVLSGIGGMALGDIALVPAVSLKRPKGIRDIAEWYMATSSRRDYVHAIFEKQVEFALANLETAWRALGETIDILFVCGTDFGTQTSTFCSAQTFRDLYFPYYKRMNEWVHAHTTWKTFKHCCGSAERFIPMFIESGFDILNPVQCSAVGMEPRGLKERFGDRLTFWGGGIDTQQVLPFGTPAEVRAQVLERCEIFARDGGFVFNAIHNIQAETPVENIVAMFDALHEFNGTPREAHA
jgi:uroporphyrinogen-III decarboxylase